MNQPVNIHKCLPANPKGRAFILSDLHGCLDLLEEKLSDVAFDPNTDRLINVGDLSNRGPDSLGCLRLIRQPWFYAVRGNHEQMLLDYLNSPFDPGPRSEAKMRFLKSGGTWVEWLDINDRNELWDDRICILDMGAFCVATACSD